jgi:hypothetical protein
MNMVNAAPQELGPLSKLLAKIAAADREDILRQCLHDLNAICAQAWLQICNWLLEAGLFALISHRRPAR